MVEQCRFKEVSERFSPPERLGARLRQLGPGIVVAGAVVGAGELIATPTLGAKVGFTALWVIILSCLLKLVIQIEMGRYTVATGKTAFHALNQVPGPRLRGNWILWLWLGLFSGNIVTLGGIRGGISQLLNLLLPGLNHFYWEIAIIILTVGILVSGRYGALESITMALVALFTLISLFCVFSLKFTPFSFSWSDLAEGLSFHLPAAGAGTAFSVIGFTGVGAGDLIVYPFWCLEKGYGGGGARGKTGNAWLGRARNWIKVMQLDVFLSTLVVTVTTTAFYLLGAAVLGGRGEVPGGFNMIRTLSNMYTETLGSWAFVVFALGSFFVLFSTFFVNVAAIPRLLCDFLEIQGILKYGDAAHRERWVTRFMVMLPLLGEAVFVLVREPLSMVLVSGICQAAFMPAVGFGLIYLRFRKLDRRLAPTRVEDVWLLLSVVVLTVVSIYPLVVKIGLFRAG